MRNKLLIPATAAVLILLAVSIVWWSHRPSIADTTVPPEQSTLSKSSAGVASPVSSSDGIVQPSQSGNPGTLAGAPNRIAPKTGTTLVAPVPGANSLPPSTAVAAASTDAAKGQQEGMIDLDKTRRMVRDYHTLMGENPVGTNAEIMKAIMGHNPHQATLGPMEGQQLNDKGELIDQWGTPYFFHQLSGNHMEIHSAGPDKIMGTKDDLILD